MIEIAAVPPLSGADEPVVRVNSEELVNSRYASYLSDESGLGPGRAEIVILPTSEKQVADFLREMNDRKIPVTLSGGRTGLVGGAVPNGGAVLALDRMNRIVGIRWDTKSSEWRVTVQPGIRLRDLQDRIARKDLGNNDQSDSNWRDLPRFLNDARRYFYPPDPTEQSASLGGTVATDASGARTYLHGRTRKHIRALRVVLATGDVLELCRGEHAIDSDRDFRIRSLDGTVRTVPVPSYESPHTKSAAGYYSAKGMDVIDLFVGSEGTLGVITQVEVALTAAPEHIAMFLAFFPSEDDAVKFTAAIKVLALKNSGVKVHSSEYLGSTSLQLLRRVREETGLGASVRLPDEESAVGILCEFSCGAFTEVVDFFRQPFADCHSSMDSAVTGMDEPSMRVLKELRHAVPEAINKIVAQRKEEIPGMHKFGTDISVPEGKFESLIGFNRKLLRSANMEYYVYGHMAENHLHVNLLPRTQEELERAERAVEDIARKAVELGGTVSAEHGIGKMKKHLLRIMFNQNAINEMLASKQALDPNMILSPGNML